MQWPIPCRSGPNAADPYARNGNRFISHICSIVDCDASAYVDAVGTGRADTARDSNRDGCTHSYTDRCINPGNFHAGSDSVGNADGCF